MYNSKRWALCCRREDQSNDLEKGIPHKSSEDKKEDELQNDSLKLPDDKVEIEEYPSSPRLPGKMSTTSATNPLSDVPLESSSTVEEPSSEASSESGREDNRKSFKVRKWPTRWYWQFLVLLVRTFRQSRHIILSKLNLVQTILLTIVSCIVWFQLPNSEDNISDRLGYVSGHMRMRMVSTVVCT